MGRRAFIGIGVGLGSLRAGSFEDESHQPTRSARPIQQLHPHPLHLEQSTAVISTQSATAVSQAVALAKVAWR